MTLFKFDRKSVIRNTVETNPDNKFKIEAGVITYNDYTLENGTYGNKVGHYDIDGDDDRGVSLYEYNVDRDAASHNPPTTKTLIYPYLVSSSDRDSLSAISTTGTQYGEEIVGSYPLLSNISMDFYVDSGDANYDSACYYDPTGTANYDSKRTNIKALKHLFNHYKKLNPLFEYDYDDGYIKLVKIPEIFFGSRIKKGSVELNVYVANVLSGTLTDTNEDGVLYQSNGGFSTHDGDPAGFVFYKEGIIALFGDWEFSLYTDTYLVNRNNLITSSGCKWYYFGEESSNISNTLFELNFKGTNQINTITMLAKADGKELNYSNNPTYLDKTNTTKGYVKSTSEFIESGQYLIKNTVKSDFTDTEEEYAPQVFINKVVVFDKDKKPIGICTIATPVKVNPQRNYLVKISYDF